MKEPFLKLNREGAGKDYLQHQFRVRFRMAISEKLESKILLSLCIPIANY